MAEQFVLSASSLNTFLRCGRQWMYAYLMGIKAPPSLRASRGIAVHSAVEYNMRQKMDTRTDLPTADVLDAFSSEYDAIIADGYEARPDETPGSVKDMGVRLTELHHKRVAPAIQPVLVEEPISFEINGQPWTGQIDLAEEEPMNLWGEPEMGLALIDTKTSASSPKPEQYAVNMTGYAIGVQQKTGRRIARVKFDYLVATKEPKYVPIDSGPVSDDQIRSFAWLVADVAGQIKKGAFPANGINNPGVCDWCGYRNICPALKAKNPNRE
jgi:hypothetical protein